MIDKETVERILDTADIVDVVSDFVHLRRRGANYVGLCPFHNEKTPSFSVSRAKGICHCFSCGKGGSPVNFIMEHEQMSYYEALKYLAKKYNIEVKEREMSDEERQAQSDRENMLIINDFAMKRFESNLFDTEEGRNIGLSYFYERKFSDAIIRKFHLGYSLENKTNLYDAIKKNGFNPSFAVESGLCIKGDYGVYDRFKGRVMFPVLNIAGKVIAFGGRTLKKDLAKYVNSPESAIYKKKHELYGLYQAKQAIVKKEKCFLVEGYTDVLSMHQAGIENVVASSGTSLTEGQIRMIHRFTDNITILYDGDAAGIKASLRGIDLLLAEGLNIKVLLLPDGDDPDSFAKKHNATEFQEYIDQHETDFIRFKTAILLNGLNDDPIKRAAAISDIIKSIAVIPSAISRAVYVKECSNSFGMEEKVLLAEVGKVIKTNKEKERSASKKKDGDTEIPAEEPSPAEEHGKAQETPPASRKATNRLRRYERNVIRYIAKYGMCDLCEVVDGNGDKYVATVLEYVHIDLTNDELTFSDPVCRKIFERSQTLLPEFKEECRQEQAKLDKLRAKLWEDGISDIRNRIENENGDIADIQKEEEALAKRIEEDMATQLAAFKTDFLEKRLCSDPDDDIRTETIDLVTEKYQLSKIHIRYTPIETEYDRLGVLVPHALMVLKDAILSENIRNVMNQLKKAESEDPAQTDLLMLQLSRLKSLKSKLVSDRVIVP